MTRLDDLQKTLTAAWLRWDQHPGHPATAAALVDATTALADTYSLTHMHLSARIATHRRGRPAVGERPALLGQSVPDAVQSAINDLITTDMKEAS